MSIATLTFFCPQLLFVFAFLLSIILLSRLPHANAWRPLGSVSANYQDLWVQLPLVPTALQKSVCAGLNNSMIGLKSLFISWAVPIVSLNSIQTALLLLLLCTDSFFFLSFFSKMRIILLIQISNTFNRNT